MSNLWHVTPPGNFPREPHRQDTGDDCGCACAQTVIWSYAQSFLEQSALSGELKDRIWGANPVSLVNKLNKLNPPAGFKDRAFKLFECTGEQTLSQSLVHSLASGGLVPCVLINGKNHWVVAYACDLASNPNDFKN